MNGQHQQGTKKCQGNGKKWEMGKKVGMRGSEKIFYVESLGSIGVLGTLGPFEGCEEC